ncbi:MAG: hypothetical protein AB8F65_12450 [Woeseiaceae bacterium]
MATTKTGMRFPQATVALFALILGACGGSSTAPDTSTAAVDPRAEDLRLAKLAYSPDERTPAGFYEEPRLYPDRSEFRFHVKSSDVGMTAGEAAYDVCSGDFAVALDWSSDSALNRDFDTTLSATAETEWYFQFERTIAGDEPGMLINRVYKCDAFDRSNALSDGFAGRITKGDFDADDLRFISEYLWQFSLYNNALHAVVDSVASDAATHDIERVQVNVGAGVVENCDRVEVWRWRHRVDAATGDLTSEQQFLRAFDARQSDSVVSLCD